MGERVHRVEMKCQRLEPKEILCPHLVKIKVGERNDYIPTYTGLCFGA